MRGATVPVFCLLLLACTATPAPTNSPAPTTSPGPSSTLEPTPQPTPTTGPTTDTGLPTSILGLPVYTVAGINQLAADGKLDGRMAAVAGFWIQEALPCAFMAHASPVLGFCNGGRFGDTAAEAQSGGSGAPAPIAVPETVGADLLWQMAGPANDPARVALIVHAADSRSWQCAAADRSTCASNLVIDRVAWINDLAADVDVANPAVSPRMRLDEVIAAGVNSDETFVLGYPLLATQLNEIDPRFVGKANGVVWYLRVMSSAPDADGIAAGRDVIVEDPSGIVVASLPLEVDATYSPARLTLDAQGWEGLAGTQPGYAISNGDHLVAQGLLGASSTPLVLEPAGYAIDVQFMDEQGNPAHGPSCKSLPVLAEGDDVSLYADFNAASCTWKEGSLFPFN
ncbi:MAG: hypothetical protein ABI744_06235 [Chloroflexota bacterium]